MTCRYGHLRLDIGIKQPHGAPVQILTRVDNARLLALLTRYLQNPGQ